MQLRDRPGANLLRLLVRVGRALGEFAASVGMAEDEAYALANIRRYTHAAKSKWPSPEMVERWAVELGVDPGEFYGRARIDPRVLESIEESLRLAKATGVAEHEHLWFALEREGFDGWQQVVRCAREGHEVAVELLCRRVEQLEEIDRR